MTQLFRDYLARVPDAQAGFPIGLLTITTRSGGLLRLNSTADRNVLSRGQTYFLSGFDFRMPDRMSEGEQRSAFVLPVSDRTLLAALASEVERLSLVFEVVFSWTVDEVELGPFRMVDVSRSYEASTQTLAVEATYRDVLRDPRPGRKYTPASYPGLFGSPNLQGVTP